MVHEQPEHGAEVVLRSGHRDLYGNRRLGVAVAAGNNRRVRAAAADADADADLQSLDARHDGVERSLDVGGGARADHWEVMVLQQI